VAYLVTSAIALFAIGLVMIFSTTSAEVLDHGLQRSPYYASLRQLLYGLVGCTAALTVKKLGYRFFLRLSPLFFFLCIFALLITLIPAVGKSVNGSRRWLIIASISFQPSEFVKYIAPLFFIYKLLKEKHTLTFLRFFQLVVAASIPIPLIAVEPNNGSAAVVGMVLLAVCLLAQIPIRYWAIPLFIGCLVVALFASQLPYVSARFQAYFNPTEDLQGKGHQPYQAKIAAGSGRLFGNGVGKSWQKHSYLPEAQNDYIAAIYAEEWGFIGMVVLIVFYGIFSTAGFCIAMKAQDMAGYYLAGSIVFLIALQVFLNLAVVSGLLPTTGLNLPFFSQGGSSLIANAMGIGLLTSIACTPRV